MSNQAAYFYDAIVTHRRFAKFSHSLRYRLRYLLIDLDAIDEAASLSPFFGQKIWHPIRFKQSDFGSNSCQPLAQWVRDYLTQAGVKQKAVTIRLLCLPRLFGYVFNPIAIFFIEDDQGNLHHCLYQVTNTFGERHFYLCVVDQHRCKENQLIHHETCKAFYVSPFFDIEGSYQFRLKPLDEELHFKINYHDARSQMALRAQLHGTRRPFTSKECFKLLWRFPLMTFSVVFGIHWNALRLFLKGAKYRKHGKKSDYIGLTKSRSMSSVK